VRLLVTRPEPDGERTAATLRGRGHDVMVAPLLRVEAIACRLPDAPFGAVVMTSANAARAVAAHPQRDRLTTRPVFTVGRQTAEAARAAGFHDVTSADGDQGDLVALLRGKFAGGSKALSKQALLYLAGEDRAGDLAGDLAAGGVPVVALSVYRAVKVERFPAAVALALTQGALDGVLHFSRRSAEAYLACARHAGVPADRPRPLHYCLSGPVSEPLSAAGAGGIRVAPRPEEAALIGLIGAE
jgi:uroporphyrinogen-III synthase